MKILWLVNVAPPEASRHLGLPVVHYGGWLVDSGKRLSMSNDVQLTVAFPGRQNRTFRGASTNYVEFPRIRERCDIDDWYPSYFTELLGRIEPDIVHIHGTEYAHTLAMINACLARDVHFVVSIQGLLSLYHHHYVIGLPERVQRGRSLRDAIKRDSVLTQQAKLAARGRLEERSLEKASNIIGRTTWDRVGVRRINPSATYHSCNETLRSEFSDGSWNHRACDPQSIFVTQGSTPIKGFHLLLEALADLSRDFPDAHLSVAGAPVVRRGVRGRIMESSYSRYIRALLGTRRLRGRVRFLGPLGPDAIRDAMLASNVFALPSTIENSPNSLGEAMLLGMPVVASYVGGVPDFVEHGVDGYLYQADAPYMLAHYLGRVFSDWERAERMGERAADRALRVYDGASNNQTLIRIYDEIVNL